MPTSEYVEKREEGDMTFVCLKATEKDGMMDAIECAVLTDEMDMEEIAAKCTGWKLAQDKEALAIAVEDKLSQITLYDKSAAVNSFILNGESHWLDFNLRDRVFQGNERLKLMGRTDTTLWLDGMCIELPIEQAQMLMVLQINSGTIRFYASNSKLMAFNNTLYQSGQYWTSLTQGQFSVFVYANGAWRIQFMNGR